MSKNLFPDRCHCAIENSNDIHDEWCGVCGGWGGTDSTYIKELIRLLDRQTQLTALYREQVEGFSSRNMLKVTNAAQRIATLEAGVVAKDSRLELLKQIKNQLTSINWEITEEINGRV